MSRLAAIVLACVYVCGPGYAETVPDPAPVREDVRPVLPSPERDPPPVLAGNPDEGAPAGFRWERWPGEDWKLVPLSRVAPAAPTTAAPGVAARTFPQYAPSIGAAPARSGSAVRSGGYHAGHNCPNCGHSQYVISGHNRDGTHNHACPSCGTVWRHRRRVFGRGLKVIGGTRSRSSYGVAGGPNAGSDVQRSGAAVCPANRTVGDLNGMTKRQIPRSRRYDAV